MAGANRKLIGAVRDGLAASADTVKAEGMRAYMKSKMPYRGVSAPELRQILKPIFETHRIGNFQAWKATTLALWREARFREERYAAIELTGHRSYREFQTWEAFPIYEEMIVTGAWWDYVDAVAVNRVGKHLLVSYRPRATKVLERWSGTDDLWKRRSSIIAQVGLKEQTDLDLLYYAIDRNLEDNEFFIRKAIGWALRAYAWVDPVEVTRYVGSRESRLSPLSRREALRNVGRSTVKGRH